MPVFTLSTDTPRTWFACFSFTKTNNATPTNWDQVTITNFSSLEMT